MRLNYLQTVLQPGDSIRKVSSLAWAPNNGKLAAATADKVVHLFDEAGEKKDKFKTKAADPNGPGTYLVRGMAFSPDSTKLAIAQSDNIVFVYRLGSDWSEKKSICNKFVQSSPVTCLCWPPGRSNDIVFGLSDGKLKLAMLKTNKTYNMYAHAEGSYVVAVAASSSGSAIVSGHLDGSVYKFTFPEQEGGQGLGHAKLLQHSCTPYALAWGGCICAAGNDSKVVFYSAAGKELQAFDYGSDVEARGFSCCTFNPSGDTAVVGAFNRVYVFSLDSAAGAWQQVAVKQVDNFYTTCSLAWKPDGSRLAVGGLTGAVDLYDASIKRYKYKGKFEFTYVSKSSVIVKTLATGSRTILKSVYDYPIEFVNVYQDRFLVARTCATLLLGDLESCNLSEIPWESDMTEKFYFESEKVCLLFRAGELSVVEYGQNEVLAVCRTEHISPYLLSVAAVQQRGAAPAAKRIAYMVDLQTIQVLDLLAGSSVLATINNDTKVDWLELNLRGSHLLYRDKRHQLHLYDLQTQQRSSLLDYCEYVQWVPGSDVVVAQSRSKLCVWYSVKNPDRVTMIGIKGDIEGLERSPGKTEVLVNEGLATTAYALDETLIDFGAALDDMDLHRAMATLEPLELTPETEAQWAKLAAVALEQEALAVAERCYAALGDVAKARYLHKLVKAVAKAGADGAPPAQLPAAVRAQLALLSKQWAVAEALLLAQGQVDEAISTYRQAHRWADAIRVADTSRHPQADELKQAHYQWLLQTSQEDKAAAVKERQGDNLAAISLFLKAGLPARAAQVIISHAGAYDAALLDSIAASLNKAGLHERCGDLYQHLGRSQEAMQELRKGHAFRKAVELARTVSPASVIMLEEEWGDWLSSQKQMDAAINHFIEAGCTVKAIEAAIAARQFTKAAGIVDFLEPAKGQPYYRRIGQHYEEANNREEAERFLLRAAAPLEAVEMWMRAGNWEAAQKVARGYLSQEELHGFYSRRGRACEANKQWPDAERAYVAAGEVEAAVAMYQRNKAWLQMLKLVQQHRREQLPQAHMLVAQALQAEGSWREAERHFCEAKEWKAAVAMYRQQGSWEDALRVAKVFGGIAAAKQVAYAWAVSLSQEEAASLLRSLGLGDAVVDHAVEVGAFEHAFQLAQLAVPGKLPDVHLKYAMFLEDSGRFQEAEGEFVEAGKPREAIDMYLHNQDWDAAMRVAEQFDPTAIMDIFSAQANAAAAAQQLQFAESLFLKAKRPEAALAMYRQAGQWQAAIRLAEAYLPGKLQELHLEMAASAGNVGAGGAEGAVARARAFERGNDFARAIDAYLSASPADTDNHDALQQCWEQAAQVAMQHQRHRMQEVVAAVAQRLVGIGRVVAAAELQEGVNDAQGAVSTLCAGGLFDRARQLAGSNAQLLHQVEQLQTQHLVASNNAEELAARGNAAAAVEMYAAQGNWERAHDLAGQSDPEMAAAYAARHAALLMRQRDWPAAAAVLARRGVNASPANFELYREVVLEVLGAGMQQRQPQAEDDARELLYRLTVLLEGSGQARQQDVADFQRLSAAVHYVSLANRARSAGLLELAAKQLTAVLRYVGIVPADRAFYEAGMAWRAAGRHNMAFVMLNHFLDVADALADPSGWDCADWADTDVACGDAAQLPEQPYATDAAREEARNYVLEVSMDQGVEQSLSTRACEHCGVDTYEANLTCHGCGAAWQPCAVSGWPVPQGEALVLRSSLVARRDDFNTWVAKFGSDPVTGTPATPLY